MKTIILAFLAFLLWVAVLDSGMTAWDTESAARDTIDNCLYNGGTPATCIEVNP